MVTLFVMILKVDHRSIFHTRFMVNFTHCFRRKDCKV